MVRADFECFFEALRDLIDDLWEPTVILESGSELTAVDPDTSAFPWAIIELDREVPPENGPALKDVTWTFSLYLWLIYPKTENENDLENIRLLFSDMVTRLGQDDRLRNMVSNSEFGPISWTGDGRQWPVQPIQGESALAGYVSATFQIIESRL